MKKRQKHNYTSELELKCLLIRIKNRNLNNGKLSIKNNNKINKYAILFNKINNKKYTPEENQRKNRIKNKIKEKAIELSEQTKIDEASYENFGNIILLMISKILTKPNFSGYTYRDEMYSDAVHKILKYLHNFDHTMISKRSGYKVNAFAYISQIIHNSVIYIINTKKKELTDMQNQVSMEIVNHQLQIQDYNKNNSSEYETDLDFEEKRIKHEFYIDYIPNSLLEELTNLDIDSYKIKEEDKIVIYIPSDYLISLDEYNELKKYFITSNFNLLRKDKDA